MVIKIQRWSPLTCNCVIEQWVDYDEEGKPIDGPNFLLMNEVCDNHNHLASREFKPNHEQLSANVKNLIEETKTRNLKQVDDRIAKAKKKKLLRELQDCRRQILIHNAQITEEWDELVEPPHAFDSHIHDKILEEQKEKQRENG